MRIKIKNMQYISEFFLHYDNSWNSLFSQNIKGAFITYTFKRTLSTMFFN